LRPPKTLILLSAASPGKAQIRREVSKLGAKPATGDFRGNFILDFAWVSPKIVFHIQTLPQLSPARTTAREW
jgi:hypothetical protein